MTHDQIELNMAVMTPKGKGIIVGWTKPDIGLYLVKLENGGKHDGLNYPLTEGSNETLDNDGWVFSAEDLTAIEEYMTEQTHYTDWQKLTALPDEPRPDEKIGAKFVVVNDGNWHLNQDDIVELVENDGTSAPYFKRINEDRMHPCNWDRLAPLPQSEEKQVKKIAPLPQPKEKKVKKLIPFTDEFDWCEEGVLVVIEGLGERYAVRAKGNGVWTVDDGKKLCDIEYVTSLLIFNRSKCQKVIYETHRPLTKREFAEFLQDNKGMVKYATDSIIYYNFLCYDYEYENDDAHEDLLFRFRGTEEWHPVTTELYEIAKEIDA